jgi:ATP-dependent exoDNAse (exonuclease V) beta subunit
MSKLKIYKASAGSGKTYTLALEYIKELLSAGIPDNYRHILAVTFTKDATGEMKDRILAELYGLAFNTQDSQRFLVSLQFLLCKARKEMGEKEIREKAKQILFRILHDYSRLNITTIDSFFQRVLRNLARELGKGSRFNLEMNTNRILSEAVHATIEKAGKNRQILNWLTKYIENKLDESKSWQIEEEIFDFSRCIYDEYFQEHEPVLRKQLQDNPGIFAELNKQQRIIQNECKSFFKKTLAEINAILDENRLEMSDFGNSKYAIALFGKPVQGDYKPTIGATVEKCCAEAGAWGGAKSKRKAEIVALAASYFIPRLQQTLETLAIMNTSQMISRNLHQLGLIWDVTEEISEQNAANNRFMLSDTALFLHRMIDHSDAPFIYEKLGAEIRHVMIDEFQDTSRLQWNNFKVFLSDIQANGRFSLIVGDVKQSIYRWRNGDWRILSNIGKELDVEELNLNYNHRSEKEIIAFNNSFFPLAARSLHELYKTYQNDANTSPFLSAYSPENVIQESPKTTVQGFVSIDFVSGKTEDKSYDEQMKETLLEKLQHLYRANIPAREICILTRYNKDVTRLADYLSSLKVERPHLAETHYLDLVSAEAFQLNSSPALKILIEALRCIADPHNPVAQAQLKHLVSENAIYPDNFASLAATFRAMPLLELITCLYNLFDLARVPGQTAYLFTFYDSVSNYLNERYADIPLFLAYWNEELYKKTINSGTGIEGIRAMSIHKSKGLQFHTVIIPYCDWDIQPRSNTTVWCGPKEGFYDLELLPVSYNKGMAGTIFAEEFKDETSQTWMDNLNLLYVAFTRAERNLLVLACDKGQPDSPAKISTVSDLLKININQLPGNWKEETQVFEMGILEGGAIENKKNDNLLKQVPEPFPVSFVAHVFEPGESIFKQSNQSHEFVTSPSSLAEQRRRESYIAYGNLMHKLFEQIHTWEDIDKSVANFLSEGLLCTDEVSDICNEIRADIVESHVEDWFSGQYKTYSEATILMKEDGELKQKRPDRVLISDNFTQVIDFKFGEARDAHKKQVKQYMQLLEDMKYPGVEGYLWYVKERKVLRIV